MDTTILGKTTIEKPVPPLDVEATESQEPSPEKVDERYLELLRQQVEEIKVKVLKAHGVTDLMSASKDERGRAITDLKLTIMNFLENEHRKLLEVSENTKGTVFKSFIEESKNWYAHNLDRPTRLGMFVAMAGEGEMQGVEIFEPTAEVVKETSPNMRARLIKTSHSAVPAKGEFLASALDYFETHEYSPNMIEVQAGDSVWNILSKALENERPN
ncbi:MAG: hypothetical protein AAB907_00585 [Patescibacteria group bacterium]